MLMTFAYVVDADGTRNAWVIIVGWTLTAGFLTVGYLRRDRLR